MGAFADSWGLFRSSLNILRSDRELLWVPLLGLLGFVSVLGSVILIALGIARLTGDGAPTVIGIVAVLWLLAFGWALLGLFINGIVVAAAVQRLQGQDPSLRSAWKTVWAARRRITAWALVTATVAVLLAALARRGGAGRAAATVGGISWSIATVFIVPTLLYEELGVWKSLRHSERTFRDSLGTTTAGLTGLGLVYGLILAAVLMAGFPLLVGALPWAAVQFGWPPQRDWVWAIVGGGTWFLLFACLVGLFWVLQGIYRASLYRYARTKVIPNGFTKNQMLADA